MLILTDRCNGCGYCINACKAHNDIPPGIEWNRIIETGANHGEARYLSMSCQHCEQAACVEACPSGARIFGDMNDPDSAPRKALAKHDPSVLKPERGTKPNVFYIREY